MNISISAALVLFAVIWFMVLFIVLPLRLVTQGEAGDVVPGTPKSAPADFQLGRKARLTTFWAIGVWAVIQTIIVSGVITIEDLEWFRRMTPGVGASE
jgi:predicted secreted protein